MTPYPFEPIEWTYQQDTVSTRYIGHCETLHITLECDELPELFASMADAVRVMVESFVRHGDLDKVGEDKGWPRGMREQMVHLAWQSSQHDKVEPTLMIRAL